MQIQNQIVASSHASMAGHGLLRTYSVKRCGGCSRPLGNGDLKVVISSAEARRHLGRRALPRLNLMCASCFADFRRKNRKMRLWGI